MYTIWFIYSKSITSNEYVIDSFEIAKDDIIEFGYNKGKNIKEICEVLEIDSKKINTYYTKYIDNKKIADSYEFNKDNIEFLTEVCVEFYTTSYNLLEENNKRSYFRMNNMSISKEEEKTIKNHFLTNFKAIFKDYKEELKLINNELSVKEIISILKEKVIGQDKALESLVPAIMLNKKLNTCKNDDLKKTQKSVILLDGPTGVGKTLIVSELANLIDMPVSISSATDYSTVGYVGSSLSTIFISLINSCNGDIEKAKNGIICLDEIDKLGDSDLEIRKGIMQELLTWISGTDINFEYKKREMTFNTSNITFIMMGAFNKVQESKNSIGFSGVNNDNNITTKDYVNNGMMSEFMGRINLPIHLNSLSKDDFKKILLKSKISPLKGLIDLGKLYNVNIEYDDELLDIIINRSLKDNIGARGIIREVNNIRSKILIPIMDNESETILLTQEMFDEDYEYINKNIKTLKA